ncbi:MAG: hypothetical protein JXB17_04575 [Bacteroidales bacterium]|nr:hypothetical protein [Bacteroidales bacterium]
MRRYKLLIFVLIIANCSFAQEQLKHEKKVYISPEGRLFINKAEPVYLWLSTSDDKSSEKYLLKSEVTAKYSNPMYFDTEGYNTVRSPWEVDTITKQTIYPLQDIIFEVYADSKSPITKIDYGDTFLHKKEGKYYVKGGIKLKFKSYDELSGIENTYYSINKQQFQKYSNEITLNEENEYFIQYYSVDNVGNIEITKSITIITDKTNPKSELKFSGDKHNDILSSRSSIEIISNDKNGILGIYYQIDDGNKIQYKYPIKTSSLAQGDHTLKYYSIDMVKNEETLNEYKFYLDKTAPTIVEEILGNSFISGGIEYSSGRTKFKITTFDNKAGVKEVYYSINGSEYKLYDNPFYLDNSSGNIVVKTYAVDYVNNKSVDNSQSNTHVDLPYIDLSGPVLDYTFIGPMFSSSDSVFISNKSKIKLVGKDPESGINKIEYKIDDSDLIEYTNPFTIDSEGRHIIFFTGTDNVNNTNQAEFIVIVDNNGPEIYSRFSVFPMSKKEFENKNIEVFPDHVVVFLSSTDQYVGFDKMYYSINGQPEKLYSGLISNFSKGKDYLLKVRALDKLGNEKSQNFEFATSF